VEVRGPIVGRGEGMSTKVAGITVVLWWLRGGALGDGEVVELGSIWVDPCGIWV